MTELLFPEIVNTDNYIYVISKLKKSFIVDVRGDHSQIIIRKLEKKIEYPKFEKIDRLAKRLSRKYKNIYFLPMFRIIMVSDGNIDGYGYIRR